MRLSCLFFLFCLQLWVFFLVAEVDDFEVSKEYVELFSWLVEKEKLATVLSVFLRLLFLPGDTSLLPPTINHLEKSK